VDLAVYAVPTDKKAEFIAHAEKVAPIFKQHGALSVADCWGNDVPVGEVTSPWKHILLPKVPGGV